MCDDALADPLEVEEMTVSDEVVWSAQGVSARAAQ
jgi:hypothetical protein